MIRDRLMLGTLAGLLGTITKSIIVSGLKRRGYAEFNGTETAAGMLLPAHKVNTPGGKVVGHLANAMMGITLGIAMTYLLTVTGKDKALVKGAGMSGVFWMLLYGNYAHLGGSSVRPALPSTILSNLAGHIAYGFVTSLTIARWGEPALFQQRLAFRVPRETGVKTLPQADAAEGAPDAGAHRFH